MLHFCYPTIKIIVSFLVELPMCKRRLYLRFRKIEFANSVYLPKQIYLARNRTLDHRVRQHWAWRTKWSASCCRRNRRWTVSDSRVRYQSRVACGITRISVTAVTEWRRPPWEWSTIKRLAKSLRSQGLSLGSLRLQLERDASGQWRTLLEIATLTISNLAFLSFVFFKILQRLVPYFYWPFWSIIFILSLLLRITLSYSLLAYFF